MKTVDRVSVASGHQESGIISRNNAGTQFQYSRVKSHPVALSMPVREAPYDSQQSVPSVFQMNLPEGYLKARIFKHFAKVARVDELFLLAIQGDRGIGLLHYHTDGVQVPDANQSQGESIDTLLHWDGKEDLFAELVNKYLTQSFISGVQPKIVVPERRQDRGTLPTTSLIVKSEGNEYPDLALNEFICMTTAKKAGIAVPEFWLSDDRRLFIMERFDKKDGKSLGMEDLGVVMGKDTYTDGNSKYTGSYEQVAKAITAFCDEQLVGSSLSEYFDSLALSCLVKNGDAHLKNFALLYEPDFTSVRLAPAYDIVNTTTYISNDQMALTLAGSRRFPKDKMLIEFGQRQCRLSRQDIEARLERLKDSLRDTLHEFDHTLYEAPDLKERLWECLDERAPSSGPKL